jgi:tetratricopeptide (TPR) repeat protein
MRPIRAACLLVAALALVPIADAQKKPKEPKRPKMDSGRDTNAAGAYYWWGLGAMRTNPRAAQDAFYWASRLDPAWADPLYAQRIAYHLSDLPRFWKYLNGTKYVLKAAETKRIDSLMYKAMLRDPFFFRRHDKMLIDRLIQELTDGYGGLMGGSPSFLAWVAYSETRFPEAVQRYAEAIKKEPEDYDLHADRARAFYLMGQFDSTVAEMNRALEGFRKMTRISWCCTSQRRCTSTALPTRTSRLASCRRRVRRSGGRSPRISRSTLRTGGWPRSRSPRAIRRRRCPNMSSPCS